VIASSRVLPWRKDENILNGYLIISCDALDIVPLLSAMCLCKSTNEREVLSLKLKNPLKLVVHNEMLIKTDISLYVIIVTLEVCCN
jgi:hypothetical protein